MPTCSVQVSQSSVIHSQYNNQEYNKKRGEDLKCIDVFVDTVHYDTSMTPGNEDWADNVATVSGCRLCLLFDTPDYGKIFCPVKESEVLDPEHAQNWLNMGPVLTIKKAQAAAPKKSTTTRKPAARRQVRKK